MSTLIMHSYQPQAQKQPQVVGIAFSIMLYWKRHVRQMRFGDEAIFLHINVYSMVGHFFQNC